MASDFFDGPVGHVKLTGTVFGGDTHLQVGLGVGNDNFTQQLGETGRVVGFFEGDKIG